MSNAVEIERVARQVARKYARRVWWADEDDLMQEAREACVRASRTWDSTVGVSLEAYLWRAAMLTLRKWCWRQSSPVSGGMHDPRAHRMGQRTQVHEDTPAADEPHQGVVLREDFVAEEIVTERDWRARVCALVQGLASSPADRLGARVLLGEGKPSEIALEHGVPVATVSAACARLRRRIAGTLDARELLVERDKK